MSRALQSDCDVIVDLRDLSFADRSLMLDLAIVARRLRRAGCTMRLRGAQPQVERVIQIVGLDRLPSVVIEAAAPAVP